MGEINSEKVIQRTFVLKKDVFEKFKIKAKNEGFTVSEALNYLIDTYVTDIHVKRV